ncbi:MAG: hypothetical protein ACRDK7_06975 [Solirubrobacteraceae bacterium]
MPHNRGTCRKPNWVGYASYKGMRKWVSGCSSVAEYEQAVQKAQAELRGQVQNPDAKVLPSCLEFAGAVIHADDVDLEENVIGVRWQLDSRTHERVPTKDGDPRWVVPSPRFSAHLEIVMPYERAILFPAIRGGYMTLANWYPHWNAVRVAAGMPNLEFYELKHRALQWMVDPVEDGGLGLDPATAALMAGHDDGGWLIANVYTKLADRRARERAKRAMHDYAERHPSEDRKPLTARQQSNGENRAGT